MTELSVDMITIGESLVVFGADEPGPLARASRFTKRLGGAETNVAIGMARLGKRVSWVSRVGADSFGDFIVRSVAAEGVDCSGVAIDDRHRTGFMLKSRADDGNDPAIEYHRRGSAASRLSIEDFDASRFASARHLHVTGIAPALSESLAELIEHAMRFMRAQGRTVSFDPNLRSTLWPNREHMVERINHFALLADWVFPGAAEGLVLTGAAVPEGIAAYYRDRGVSAVVVKLGSRGAYVASDNENQHVPGILVANVVDTVGAGDGFAAGALSARMEGLTWAEAARRGNVIGARVIQTIGDVEGLPHHDPLPN